MKVQASVFPIAGATNRKQELELTLEMGNLEEALAQIEERLVVNLPKTETLLLLHNGQGLDLSKEAVFNDGDQLWILQQISGG